MTGEVEVSKWHKKPQQDKKAGWANLAGILILFYKGSGHQLAPYYPDTIDSPEDLEEKPVDFNIEANCILIKKKEKMTVTVDFMCFIWADMNL